jgi:DNA-binding NarL/FixJ family response regulator
MSPIRVMLADDHNLLRAGVRALLHSVPGVEIVAEASNGREALEGIHQHRPDVLLMDIAMPGMNGLEALARISKEHPDVRVIILSMHATEEYVHQAFKAGASGYLLKDAAAAELDVAVRAVARGETYLTPAVSRHVVEYLRRAGNGGSSADLLTPRQREILQLIAEGKTTKEIARVLSISVKTVETHRLQLMERLAIHDVPGLVRYAIRHRLVQLDQ